MRVRKLVIRSLLVIALLASAIALAVFAMLRSTPGWYSPMTFTPDEQARAGREVQDRIAALSNAVTKARVQRSVPMPSFEVEFTEAQVNGLLSRWREWGPLGKALQTLHEPHVRFLDDRIILAGRSAQDGPIISMELSVDSSSGAPLVTLGRPYIGRLPLTRSLLERASGELDRAIGSGNIPIEFADPLRQLIAGEPTPPIAVLPSKVVGESSIVPAKVEKLVVGKGILKATLRPIQPTTK